jgi:hypothetical protein
VSDLVSFVSKKLDTFLCLFVSFVSVSEKDHTSAELTQ